MTSHKFSKIQGQGEVRRISLKNELKAPILRVWDTITEVRHLKSWWPDWKPGGTIEKCEGGTIKLGDGSWIDGTIKVWRPPHIFEFVWQENIMEESQWYEKNTQNLLRIDLVEVDKNTTLLHLIQFAPKDSVIGGAAGWHHFAGERLPKYLENIELLDDEQRFYQIKLLYEGD